MKTYTDIEQSKRLAEILPLKSADMSYRASYREDGVISGYQATLCPFTLASWIAVPCWSLAALLDVLQKTAYSIDEDANVMLCSYKTVEWNLGINNSDLELVTESNPIDACYEMICKFKEQKII